MFPFFCYALFIEPTPRFLCQGIQTISFLNNITIFLHLISFCIISSKYYMKIYDIKIFTYLKKVHNFLQLVHKNPTAPQPSVPLALAAEKRSEN